MTDEFDDLPPRPVPADCPCTLTRVRFAGGQETPRFEAHLLRGGVHIATVANGGAGGAGGAHPTLAGDGWGAVREFEAYAKTWGDALVPPVEFEPNVALVYELLERWYGSQPIYRVATPYARAQRPDTISTCQERRSGEGRDRVTPPAVQPAPAATAPALGRREGSARVRRRPRHLPRAQEWT